MPEYKGFYITEETSVPGPRWCIYKDRRSWLNSEPEIHRSYSLLIAENWVINRRVYEPLEAEDSSPIRKQLATIRAKQDDPLYEELPVTEEDHEACRKYGSKSAVRKFRDKSDGTISTFCEL